MNKTARRCRFFMYILYFILFSLQTNWNSRFTQKCNHLARINLRKSCCRFEALISLSLSYHIICEGCRLQIYSVSYQKQYHWPWQRQRSWKKTRFSLWHTSDLRITFHFCNRYLAHENKLLTPTNPLNIQYRKEWDMMSKSKRNTFKVRIALYFHPIIFDSPADRGEKVKVDYFRSFIVYSC